MRMVRRLATLLLLVAAQAALAQGGGPEGAALFAQHCATCHQADASGTVGLAPPLKGAHWARLGADRAYLPTVLLHGLSGPIQVGGQRFVGSMPAFGAQLDDASLAAVANHLKRLQGAEEPVLGADEFKAQRQLAGSPPQTRQRRVQLLGN
ncbi:c-type cytochrome [Paucibacter soli]|uniref:c-type cytochrome n=1 Tax=Paucibacter soli TaxID=3133433 RepID=UPI00309FFA08